MTESLPHSIEAEQAVLGAVLQSPGLLDDLDFLCADDFFILRHKWVWNTFQAIAARNDSIDLLTLTAELRATSFYEEYGGAAFLTELSNSYYLLDHVHTYAEMIKRCSLRRRLLDAGSEIATLAIKSSDALEEVLAQAEDILFRYTRADDEQNQTSLSCHLLDYYDLIEQRYREGGLSGLPTGFDEYDHLTGGLHAGELTLVGARPSMGKTSLLLNIGYNVARSRKQVLFLSLEMTESALCNRLMASHTGMDSHLLSAGQLQDVHWEKFTSGMSELLDLPLHLHYQPGITPGALRSLCRRHQKRHGLDLVIVDYLGLMGTEEKFSNDNSKVSYLSRSLKILAGELQVPILMACQLSREMRDRADKRPQLWDLRDSGSLEQDADNVVFINRPDYYVAQDKPGMAEIILAKQRNGPIGLFILKFSKSQTRFENAADRREKGLRR